MARRNRRKPCAMVGGQDLTFASLPVEQAKGGVQERRMIAILIDIDLPVTRICHLLVAEQGETAVATQAIGKRFRDLAKKLGEWWRLITKRREDESLEFGEPDTMKAEIVAAEIPGKVFGAGALDELPVGVIGPSMIGAVKRGGFAARPRFQKRPVR